MAVATGALVWLGIASRSRRKLPWVVFGLHAALAVAAATRYTPEGRDATPADAASTTPVLRVLTLNSGRAQHGSEGALRELLATVRPTVIAFQETSIRSGEPGTPLAAPRQVMTLLGLGGYTLSRFPEGQTETSQPIAATVPLSLQSTGPLDPVSGGSSGGYSRSILQWDGREIAVYNVHLRSYSPDRPWLSGEMTSAEAWSRALGAFQHDILVRSAEAEAVRQMLAAETRPFLVVGDFNGTPDQWSTARIADGLVNTLRATSGWAGTFPDQRPLVQIDAILASPHWTVRNAYVAPAGLSDHRAVIAELILLDAVPDV